MVLPRWYLYSRKHQGDKGSASWQEGQKPIQIRAGVHLTLPSEPHKPLSNRCFQIFVIYLAPTLIPCYEALTIFMDKALIFANISIKSMLSVDSPTFFIAIANKKITFAGES